ncbi:hypothetical protein [Paenibacillus sp. KN14-4R]|uniref:hypothetical protein n=1 Tax=Paenibacillus sp. KN14-4R TaxID=3445773 RepID=UPI003FA12F65
MEEIGNENGSKIDNEKEKKTVKPREITYQVGWKKGRMLVGNPVVSPPPASKRTGPRQLLDLCHRYLFKEAPLPSSAVLEYCLWALPVVSFLLTVLLVYMLVY